jgi:hypothetical protein
MIKRETVQTLKRLGPEQVIDGHERCPQCDGLSPMLSIDERIIHCSLCHNAHAVTVEDADQLVRQIEGAPTWRPTLVANALSRPRHRYNHTTWLYGYISRDDVGANVGNPRMWNAPGRAVPPGGGDLRVLLRRPPPEGEAR